QVFFADITDMARKILPQPGGGLPALVIRLGVAQRRHRFERELGVDCQRPPVRQEYRAIRAASVRKRELEFVTALGQAILYYDLEAARAERAALLLVGQHALQRGHLGRQIGDVLLRMVDDREPLVELLQAFDRLLSARAHGLVEVVGYRVEPLVDGAVKLRLTAGERVAQALDAHGRLRLQPRKLDHLALGGLPVASVQEVGGPEAGKRRQQQDDRDNKREHIIRHARDSTLISLTADSFGVIPGTERTEVARNP